MTTRLVLTLVLVGWVSIGPVLSVVMGRRGFSPPAWGTVGMFLGPLALPLAADALWRRRRDGEVSVLATAAAGPGPVSVLAGIDGSPEAATALARSVELLGQRIGRLTLVYVASVDAATDPALLEREELLAARFMAAAGRGIPNAPAEECVVPGRPASTLAHLATDGGYDLVVVGRRGQGCRPGCLAAWPGSWRCPLSSPSSSGGNSSRPSPASRRPKERSSPCARRERQGIGATMPRQCL